MATSKKTIFCTKCGEKNSTNSTYCTNCGAKLVNPKKIAEEDPNKKREEDKKLNQVTLKNMPAKISDATLIVAKVIIKTSIVTFKPKQPTRYDSYSTRAFVIIGGTLRYASDVTDEVKRKVLDDLDTDLDIDKVEWATPSSVSFELRDKGWNAVSCGTQWYIWPVNGSTIKSLVTVDYIGGKPKRNIVSGGAYSKKDMEHDETSETIWAIIGFIALILFIIFLIAR